MLTVRSHDGSARSGTFEEPPKNGAYFSYMVKVPEVHIHQIYITNIEQLASYLVLDTACQRTCCSSAWFDAWSTKAAEHRMMAKLTPCQEPFEFGRGPLQYSSHHVLLPAVFVVGGSPCLLGTSIIKSTNDIPLLGSNDLLENKLKTTLDLPQQRAFLRFLAALNVWVPIMKVNGHLVFNVMHFDCNTRMHRAWKQLSELCDDGSHDREFLCTSAQPSIRSCVADAQLPREEDRGCASSSMAAELAPHGGTFLQSRDAAGHLHRPGSADRTSSKGMDCSPGPDQCRDHGGHHERVDEAMPARDHPEIREQVPPVLQVSDVRQEVDVERKPTRMARTPTIPKVIATAVAILINSFALHRGGIEATLGRSIDEQDRFAGQEISTALSSEGASSTHESLSFDFLSPQQVSAEAKAPHRCADGAGLGQRLRMGPSGRESMSSEARIKHGTKAWLSGHLKHVQKDYEREDNAYKSLVTHYKLKTEAPQIDLLELFAGTANLTWRAHFFGLNALEPVDKALGHDLKTSKGQDEIWQILRTFRPLLVTVAWPCTQWSIMNENCNYSQSSERWNELEALRDEERHLLQLGADVCIYQNDHDRYYPGENPQKSRIWSQPVIEPVMNSADNLVTVCDGGAYGAETLAGFPNDQDTPVDLQ